MTEPRTTTESIDYRARLEALIADVAKIRDEVHGVRGTVLMRSYPQNLTKDKYMDKGYAMAANIYDQVLTELIAKYT